MNMIKLNYKEMGVEGIKVKYAKYRKNRSIRLSITDDGTVKVTCPYFITEPEIYEFVRSKNSWIETALDKIKKKESLQSKPKLTKKELDALKSLIDKHVYKYLLLLGVEINDVRLRKMKSEWGNCNYTKRVLTFNTHLYYMSERFIEAIVLHEVAHMFVQNHSKKFYDLINKHMKDYRERLKEEKLVSLR